MSYGAPPGPGGYGPPPGGYGPPAGSYGQVAGPYAAVYGTSIVKYSEKSRGTAFLLSLFLGWLGVDRFYTGHTLLGVLKLLSCGGLFLWSTIDLILFALGAVKDHEGLPLTPPQIVEGTPTVNGNHVLLAGVLAGNWGIDRFLLGQTGLGILKLCTCGGFGLWHLVDLILVATGNLRDARGNSLRWD
jgi:TM2 domain-containing membrane protein YozV